MYACITSEEFEKNENYSIFAMCLCQALNYQNEEKDRAYFTFDNFVEFLKDKKFSLEDISKMIKYLLEIKYIVVADRDSDGKEYYRYNFSFIKDCLKHYRFIGIHNKYVEYAFDEVAVSFNPQFLADPFKRLDVETVTLKMNDATSPIAIKSNDGFLYVIMPMRKT